MKKRKENAYFITIVPFKTKPNKNGKWQYIYQKLYCIYRILPNKHIVGLKKLGHKKFQGICSPNFFSLDNKVTV